MTDPLEVVAILDVNAPVVEADFRHILAQERRNSKRFYLSKCGAPEPKAGDGTLAQVDWVTLATAVDKLAAQVQQVLHEEGGELYFVAKAPLPLCAQLGCSLSRLRTAAVVLNPRRGGAWERYPLQAPETEEPPRFFDTIVGLDAQREDPAQGCIAVYIATVGGATPVEKIGALLEERGQPLARIVQIRTQDTKDITSSNAPLAADQLKRLIPQVQSIYPHASSYAFFLAGPVPMAIMVGQAINLHQYPPGKVWFAHYNQGRYEYALTVPFRAPGRIDIVDSAEAREKRRDVLEAIAEGVQELQRELTEDDLSQERVEPQPWLRFLRDLKVTRDSTSDAFVLSVLHRRITLGRGLLQALTPLTPEQQKGIGQLLLLHEVFHDSQDLRYSNYYDVGRAGVVLEAVDFAADAFALRVLIRWHLRTNGSKAQSLAGEQAAHWVALAILGIESFDRAEQGKHIERLYERRLRRYLVWHLQHARASTIRSPADVNKLLGEPLTAELAPLTGFLDDRGDKVVRGARADTEFFAALGGHLIRQEKTKSILPASLLDAVRSFDRNVIRVTMDHLVEAHRRVLADWTL